MGKKGTFIYLLSCLLFAAVILSAADIAAMGGRHLKSDAPDVDIAPTSVGTAAPTGDLTASGNNQGSEAGAPAEGSEGKSAPAENEGKKTIKDDEGFDLDLEKLSAPKESQGARTLSLEDCVARAMERSIRIKSSNQEVEAAKGQLTEAKAAYWPVMEYNWRLAPVPENVDNALNDFFAMNVTLFSGFHVGVGVPVMTFGQLHMAKGLAQGGVEAARINNEKTRNNVVYQVKQLYYGIQFADETIKLLNDAIEKMGDKINQEESKPTSGMDPYDLMQMKAFKIELERRLDETQQNRDLAFEGMRIVLDLEPGAEIELDDDNLKPILADLENEKEYIEAGMTLQPESRLLDIGVDTKRRQYRLEKYKLLPKAGLGFFVDLGRTTGSIQGVKLLDDYNNPFNYSRAGVGLQIAGTLDFHGAAGRIKKARAEYYKAAYDRILARRGLEMDIRRAFLDAKRAQSNVKRAKKAQSIANQMMFITKINSDTGIGDQTKYGDALKLVLLTRGTYFKAIFDYNMALADLEQRIGEAKYSEIVPKPNIEEYDAFSGDEEDEGFITLESEGKGNGNGKGNIKGKDNGNKGNGADINER